LRKFNAPVRGVKSGVEEQIFYLLKNDWQRLQKLEYIDLWQGQNCFYAFVDSGATCNCIGGALAEKLMVDEVLLRNSDVYGVGGITKISKKVKATFALPVGVLVQVELIIMDDFGVVFLLGLPFLRSIGAIIDFRLGMMITKFGVIELINGEEYQMNSTKLMEWEDKGSGKGSERAYMIQEIGELEVERAMKKANLNFEEKVKVAKALMEFGNIWKSGKRGATAITQHRIELTTHRPLIIKPRRFPEDQQKVIEEEVKKMEADGVIEDSSGSYATEVVLVKKPTGEWRVCIDYRLLNKYTISDKYPLPRIQDLLRAIQGSKFFIALDLCAGYWQILMEDKSKDKTGFRTPRGLKQFKVMPFGLKNAPATFQRMMDEIFGDLYWKGVLVYIDDILIHSSTFEQAFLLFLEVLERLRKANLTIKMEKCDFFPRRVKYLGYFIEDGRLYPNPAKVEVLKNIQAPKNVKGVRGLLGIFGYFRQFIPQFAKIAEPLTGLTKKSAKFVWTQEHENAKLKLIEALSEQTLYNPIISDFYQLETDASDFAVGAILSCSRDGIGWKPVEFMSKKLTEVQQRWPVHEREAYAIVIALEKFDFYLRGKTFKVLTDNSSLQWMLKAQTGKIARWASRLAEYDMVIMHKSGCQMEHVDFLSRYICVEEETLDDRMVVWMANDVNLSLIDSLVEAQRKEQPLWGKGYAMCEGLIFYRGKAYVPPSLRTRIIESSHLVNPVVHPGSRKTKNAIGKVFAWPNMDADIGKYIQSCLLCQRIRPGIQTLCGRFRKHDLGDVLEKVYMDIWSVSYRGKQYKCLTMIDSRTRWAEVCEIPNETAEEVANAFFLTWVARFGVPGVVVTDRGPNFMSMVFNSWCFWLGIKHVRTSPYNPQGNALVESFHRHLNKSFVRHGIGGANKLSFSLVVAISLMGYRNIIHLSLGESPAFMLYGIDL